MRKIVFNCLFTAVLGAVAAIGSGCGRTSTGGASGHLMIIGGSLSAQNAEVYDRLVSLTDGGKWVVLPTASGVAETSGPSAAERINQYGGEGTAEVVDIRPEDFSKAFDEAYIRRISAARGIFFTGGSQSRILAVFRPQDGDTPAYRAMRRVLADGGVIAGTSAGAAMMSDPMIRSGSSRAALRFGRIDADDEEEAERGMPIGEGMGFFPYGLTDQHFLTRGRLGRLVVALEETPFTRGYGVEDNRAFHVDLSNARIEALGGSRALLVVDSGSATREGTQRQNIRISLLNSGDTVNGLNGLVTPASGRVPLDIQPGSGADLAPVEDAWGRHAVPDVIEEMAFRGARMGVLTDDGFEVRLIADEQTRYFVNPDGERASLLVINLRMDILPVAGE